MKNEPPRIPTEALVLGVGGLIPFVGLAGVIVLGTAHPALDAWRALALYGAVILSFMGGVHWGLALKGTVGTGYSASVVPAIVAWLAVVALPPRPAVTAIAIGFALLLLYDIKTVKQGGVPVWYSPLRVWLTTIVLASLALALVATSGR